MQTYRITNIIKYVHTKACYFYLVSAINNTNKKVIVSFVTFNAIKINDRVSGNIIETTTSDNTYYLLIPCTFKSAYQQNIYEYYSNAFLEFINISNSNVFEVLSNKQLPNILQKPFLYVEELGIIKYKQLDKHLETLIAIHPNISILKARTVHLLKYFLSNQYAKHGHMCYPIEKFEDILICINSINQNIQIELDDIYVAIEENNNIFAMIDNYLFLKELYELTNEIVESLKCRLSYEADSYEEIPNYNILTIEQYNAINYALNNPLTLVVGEAGTGKTFTIKNIIKKVTENGRSIIALAPTGKAANKIKQSLCNDIPCKTIHRALCIAGSNKYAEIKYDYVIIDECSLIDANIFNILLKCTMHCKHLILVGDTNQLPPLGGGNVFNDLVKSKLTHMLLSQIKRQKGNNTIIANAHSILLSDDIHALKTGNDFFIIDTGEKDIIASSVFLINKFCKQRNLNIKEQLILSPNIITVNSINKMIQTQCNSSLLLNGYKIGDKVMQNKNNAIRNTYNGEVGFITAINKDTINVAYIDKNIKYTKKQMNEINLAYALTVHKSQGSEADNVFFIIPDNCQKMLNKNMLYTAITRARKNIVILGKIENIEYCLKTEIETKYSVITSKVNEFLQD